MGFNLEYMHIWSEEMGIEGWINTFKHQIIDGMDCHKQLEEAKEELRLHKLKHKVYYDGIPYNLIQSNE